MQRLVIMAVAVAFLLGLGAPVALAAEAPPSSGRVLLSGPVAELLVPGRELAARKWERWQGCVTQSQLTARAPARGARQGVVVAPSDGFSPPPRGGADGWLGSTGPLQPAQ